MPSYNLKEIHRLALDQRRHLETLILSIFSIITVIGAGSAVVFDQLAKHPHTDLDIVMIFAPLLLALLSCITAVASHSLYIIDPDPAKLPKIEKRYDSEDDLFRKCFEQLISENTARTRGLGIAFIGILFGVSNFVNWLIRTSSSHAADSSPDGFFELVRQDLEGSLCMAVVFLLFLMFFISRIAALRNKPLKTAIKEKLVMNIVDKDLCFRRPSRLTVEITDGEQTTELGDSSDMSEE